ncbi:MAG: MFS transporter [Candidatus Heimdallarchaeota archaeon]|nr:MFS transporter [Candidatus Heimdallarchaeota archaeon]
MTDPRIEPVSLDIIHQEEAEAEDMPDIKKEESLALYSRSMAVSIANGLVSPFVSFIALKMGSGPAILGWVQAIANLLRQFLDPIFGRISDLMKRRIPFIIISTITWTIPYAFLYFVNAPAFIILIAALVNILMSFGNPAWTALQNELFPSKVRGKLTGRVTWFGSLGSMLATLFTGVILTFAFGENIDYKKFIYIPVAIGVIISIIAIIPLLRITEPLQREGAIFDKTTRPLKESLRDIFKNKPFVKFTLLYSIFGLFWTFSWPLFSIKQVNILGATPLEIALLEIVFALTSMLFILLGAKFADKYGRTKLVFLNRFCLFLFPLLYIFASQVWHLYLIHFFVSSLFSFGFGGVNAYILDLIPVKDSGLYYGFLSMVTGLFYFAGTLAGGYMVEILQNWYSQEISLNITLAFVSGMRFLLSFMFLSLKEVKEFPATLKFKRKFGNK